MTELPATATDPQALQVTAELVQRHQAAVWRYLRVLGCDAAVADDLLQETFVALLQSDLVDHGPDASRAWLRRTARNLFLAHCRRVRRAPAIADEVALERAFERYDRDDDGEGYRMALRACLGSLPERQRSLLELQMRGGASPQQLAEASGLAPEGARSLLRRIKQALRACVHRRIHDDR